MELGVRVRNFSNIKKLKIVTLTKLIPIDKKNPKEGIRSLPNSHFQFMLMHILLGCKVAQNSQNTI